MNDLKIPKWVTKILKVWQLHEQREYKKYNPIENWGILNASCLFTDFIETNKREIFIEFDLNFMTKEELRLMNSLYDWFSEEQSGHIELAVAWLNPPTRELVEVVE